MDNRDAVINVSLSVGDDFVRLCTVETPIIHRVIIEDFKPLIFQSQEYSISF